MRIIELVASVWEGNGTIHVRLSIDREHPTLRYCFVLIKDGEQIEKTRYTDQRQAVFQVQSLGRYVVKGFVRNTITDERCSEREIVIINELNAPLLAGLPYQKMPARDVSLEEQGVRVEQDGSQVSINTDGGVGNSEIYWRHELYYEGHLCDEFGPTRLSQVAFNLLRDGEYKVLSIKTHRETACSTSSSVTVPFVKSMVQLGRCDKAQGSSLDIVFTIDTEHLCGGDPIRISGDLSKRGIQENFGVRAIMDIFEEFGVRAVFFVNVYEADSFSPEYEDYMPSLLREIEARGHEVALHCHMMPKDIPSGTRFPNNQKNLSDLDLRSQIDRLDAGADYIAAYTGRRPVSFRGGAYRVNDETFVALEATGFKVDSSSFYLNSGNRMSVWKGISRVHRIGNVIEFPVVMVVAENGALRKLDFDVLSLDNLLFVLENFESRQISNAVQVMFHSFSFLLGSKRDGVRDCLYDFGRGKRCYGGNLDAKQRLRNLLGRISQHKCWHIRTFRDLAMASFNDNKTDAGIPDSSGAQANAIEWNLNNSYDAERDSVSRQYKPSDLFLRNLVGHVVTMDECGLRCRLVMNPWTRPRYRYQFLLKENTANAVAPLKRSDPVWGGGEVCFGQMDRGLYRIETIVYDEAGCFAQYVIRNIKVD